MKRWEERKKKTFFPPINNRHIYVRLTLFSLRFLPLIKIIERRILGFSIRFKPVPTKFFALDELRLLHSG